MLTAPVTDRLLYAHNFASVAAVHYLSYGMTYRDDQPTSPLGFSPIATDRSILFFSLRLRS